MFDLINLAKAGCRGYWLYWSSWCCLLSCGRFCCSIGGWLCIIRSFRFLVTLFLLRWYRLLIIIDGRSLVCLYDWRCLSRFRRLRHIGVIVDLGHFLLLLFDWLFIIGRHRCLLFCGCFHDDWLLGRFWLLRHVVLERCRYCLIDVSNWLLLSFDRFGLIIHLVVKRWCVGWFSNVLASWGLFRLILWVFVRL